MLRARAWLTSLSYTLTGSEQLLCLAASLLLPLSTACRRKIHLCAIAGSRRDARIELYRIRFVTRLADCSLRRWLGGRIATAARRTASIAVRGLPPAHLQRSTATRWCLSLVKNGVTTAAVCRRHLKQDIRWPPDGICLATPDGALGRTTSTIPSHDGEILQTCPQPTTTYRHSPFRNFAGYCISPVTASPYDGLPYNA